MAPRRTRVVLSIPWDDEDNDHPANWDYENLMDLTTDEDGVGVLVIDFEEVNKQGGIEPV